MTELKDKEIVNNLMFSQNIGRVPLFVLVAVSANLLHIIFFFLHLGQPGTSEYIWSLGVISGHALIATSSIILGILVYLHQRYSLLNKKAVSIVLFTYLVFIIIAGIAIVTFDQLVTPSITPIFVLSVVLAMVFILKPQHSLILYSFTFILFFFALSFTQENPDILLSNRVNGLTICFLGFLLSWILWRKVIQNYRQRIIIEKQSKDLEERNKQLTDQSAKLETAISSRDRFMSVISHDLKSPFNSLLGFSDILIEEWEELTDEEKIQIVHLIKETSETTFQMLLNLLDWSRLQKERIKAQPKSIPIKELVDNVILQLNAQANLKGIKTNIDIESDLIVFADEQMITSVFRNLVSNAIKFSPKDSVVTIIARTQHGEFLCSVEDTGVGLSEEAAARIFQSGTTTNGTERETGTGLGLKLCREFVQAHQGKIWVESKPGKGAKFFFAIPQIAPTQ
jgi:two-component system, sensor histidine kinase and response regulator